MSEDEQKTKGSSGDQNESDKASHKVLPRTIEEEMKTSYIDYAMSVIVGRALPDVRDGLKPVHRRILHSMNEAGITRDKPYKKSARIVGDVLGKYHPHGDTAVYDTMVRMAQDFSLRYPLVDGQGNFGSVDGDRAAAMRYTESRMSRIAGEMIADINMETVDFVPNYDGSMKEPTVLPAMLPNLLVNGSTGIAVGMATNIPPHNLSEVVDAIVACIDKPEIELSELLKVLPAPDFPTGGIIYGVGGIIQAYQTGRGQFKVRAKVDIQEATKKRKHRILVTELPYQVNKARLLENTAQLVKKKIIDGITDLRDESDRNGMRIVIELRRDANPEIIMNLLYKHTQMQVTFGINYLALVNNQPKVLGIKQTIGYYITHRQEVVRRRTEFRLRKAQERQHILDGLLVALDNIDEVIAMIRKAQSPPEAKDSLMAKFLLDEIQAKAILEMRLQKLTGMERQSIKDEHMELSKIIARLDEILADETEVFAIIRKELLDIKGKYGDERRTEIVTNAIDLDIEDLIDEEDVVVTISNTGYIKRQNVDVYRTQRRGGVGLIGMETKDEDFVTDCYSCSTHDYTLFFTNHGKVFWLKTYKIPVGGRHAKGKAIVNLLPELDKGEKVAAFIPVREFSEDEYLIFSTRRGYIKKTALIAYSHPRVTGIWAIRLDEGDELVEVKRTDGSFQIVLATALGKACMFKETDVRPMGRYTRGVIGVRLKGDDKMVSMARVHEDSVLLTITERGYGKRSAIKDYRMTKRGAQGVIDIRTGERNGRVVAVMEIEEDHEIMVSTIKGMIIRMPIAGISIIHRATMGVRVMRLRENDKVISVARLLSSKDADIELGEDENGDVTPSQNGADPSTEVDPITPKSEPEPIKELASEPVEGDGEEPDLEDEEVEEPIEEGNE